MDPIYYEMENRKAQSRLYIPGLPAEFAPILIKIPYTSQGRLSKILLALAEQMIKTGTAIKNTQLRLNKQENF